MQRIAVVGPCGAGKSTLARRLGARTGLPVTHLDALFWLPGWKESRPEEFDAKLTVVAAGERWIIEGNYARTLPIRLARADAVIIVDAPRVTCVWRAFTRAVKNLGRVRPDLAPGCPEKIDLNFLWWAWRHHAEQLDKVHAALAGAPVANPARTVIHLRSARDARALMRRLTADSPTHAP